MYVHITLTLDKIFEEDIFSTQLVGNAISVGSHLVTNRLKTSTVQEITFIAEKILAIKTRNSIYSIEIID